MQLMIEQISLWGAVLGSLLLALNISISGWAFIPYLFSNAASIYLLQKSNAPRVLIWQCLFFVIINTIGIIRWLM